MPTGIAMVLESGKRRPVRLWDIVELKFESIVQIFQMQAAMAINNINALIPAALWARPFSPMPLLGMLHKGGADPWSASVADCSPSPISPPHRAATSPDHEPQTGIGRRAGRMVQLRAGGPELSQLYWRGGAACALPPYYENCRKSPVLVLSNQCSERKQYSFLFAHKKTSVCILR